ncbi:MAG TPA: FAD-dependent oxidoreductase, partial [Rhodocyclaceae bacterium]|nr:FAD-dependent oxidoreductase [Rhodocyclaceae bacterium]
RLLKREEVAEGTMAFHFEKPAGFSFRPGQAAEIILTDVAGNDQSNSQHAFSIVSAPSQNELVFATRMRDSAFKNTLKSLAIGSFVDLDGPFGSLTLHNDRNRPAVLIAGGIGITPFVSILRHACELRLPHRLVLLYSNRRPEDAAFLAELQDLAKQNDNFQLVATMTQMSGSRLAWQGKTTLMDEALIKSAADGLSSAIYYLVGPPGMVEAMRQTLHRIGVDDDDIRTEEFYGY